MAKVLVSIDDARLRRIDRLAKARGLSRSAYLAQLAERDAARSHGPGSTPAARRALARLDERFADGPRHDSTRAIRAQREARLKDVVLDASVALKWFRAEGERHLDHAMSLRTAFEAGTLIVLAPPLLRLEIVDVAGRRWQWAEA